MVEKEWPGSRLRTIRFFKSSFAQANSVHTFFAVIGAVIRTCLMTVSTGITFHALAHTCFADFITVTFDLLAAGFFYRAVCS